MLPKTESGSRHKLSLHLHFAHGTNYYSEHKEDESLSSKDRHVIEAKPISVNHSSLQLSQTFSREFRNVMQYLVTNKVFQVFVCITVFVLGSKNGRQKRI